MWEMCSGKRVRRGGKGSELWGHDTQLGMEMHTEGAAVELRKYLKVQDDR